MADWHDIMFLAPSTGHPTLALGNFRKGTYRFTSDLLALEAASPALTSLPYDTSLSPPLQPEAWRRALHTIPDRQFTEFLMRGITYGFRIGLKEGAVLKPARHNLKSAYDHPDIISAYLQRRSIWAGY